MRLMSFQTADGASWGVAQGDEVADIGRVDHAPRTLRAALENGTETATLIAKARRLPLASVVFLPVIPDPGKIICVGLNYDEHRKESGREVVGYPTLFVRFADSQVGHGAALLQPSQSGEFDYEAELALVIGKAGRHIDRAQAFDHVAGYACYNDGSVRDWQNHTSQFTAGKNFVGTGGFGPWLVTPDEVGPLAQLRISLRHNGQTVQQATLGQMIFDIPAIIAYCSTFTVLRPGDVIVTGTPAGVGMKRQPPLWMNPGDVVEVEIDRVGLLRNPVERAS